MDIKVAGSCDTLQILSIVNFVDAFLIFNLGKTSERLNLADFSLHYCPDVVMRTNCFLNKV